MHDGASLYLNSLLIKYNWIAMPFFGSLLHLCQATFVSHWDDYKDLTLRLDHNGGHSKMSHKTAGRVIFEHWRFGAYP